MTIPNRGRSARLLAADRARVSPAGSRASVEMRCSGAGKCSGGAQLTARVRKSHRRRTAAAAHRSAGRKHEVLLGRGRYAIAAGSSTKVRIRVAKRYRRLLRRREVRHAMLTAGGGRTRIKLLVRGKRTGKRQRPSGS